MTIFFYKRLARNLEIGNTPVWVFPSIWRLARVMDTKFGTNVSNRMLLNVAKFQGYSFYRFWVFKGKPTGGGGKITPSSHTQIRVKRYNNADLKICQYLRLHILRYAHVIYVKSLFTNIQQQQNMLKISLVFKKITNFTWKNEIS